MVFLGPIAGIADILPVVGRTGDVQILNGSGEDLCAWSDPTGQIDHSGLVRFVFPCTLHAAPRGSLPILPLGRAGERTGRQTRWASSRGGIQLSQFFGYPEKRKGSFPRGPPSSPWQAFLPARSRRRPATDVLPVSGTSAGDRCSDSAQTLPMTLASNRSLVTLSENAPAEFLPKPVATPSRCPEPRQIVPQPTHLIVQSLVRLNNKIGKLLAMAASTRNFPRTIASPSPKGARCAISIQPGASRQKGARRTFSTLEGGLPLFSPRSDSERGADLCADFLEKLVPESLYYKGEQQGTTKPIEDGSPCCSPNTREEPSFFLMEAGATADHGHELVDGGLAHQGNAQTKATPQHPSRCLPPPPR